mmetsp:Transcript_4413/g.5229  ORF Transcript_4413/g.5229 Transcript_4413/m.5229 type:complete len:135 (-) Transcript_4413:40-444(-)
MGRAAAWMTPPDGREYRGSTEAWSLLFTEDRESRELRVRGISAGYVVDWFEDGISASDTEADKALPPTTGGRGLSFGFLNTLGMPLPTTPRGLSLRLIQWISGKLDGPGGYFPKAVSDPDTIPKWWKDKRRGAD